MSGPALGERGARPARSRGYFRCGVPYGRFGHGPRTLVVFQGLMFENRPPRWPSMGYRFLQEAYTVYVVLRRPGLPSGYTMRDMADDYAVMIGEELGGPVDVIGVSTGGSIAQHFAADHPELVRRLVLHSAAHVLSDHARRLQLRLRDLALQRRWAAAYALVIDELLPRTGAARYLRSPAVTVGPRLLGAFAAPASPSDLAVTIEAEDAHAFRERLPEITAPTLVVAGENDPFYTPALFRETAEGIPGARLILYPGMGHPATGKQFARDLRAFLLDEPDLEREGQQPWR